MPGKAKRMPSTTIYRRGQVVVVTVPFTGQTGSKPRPALVVSVEAFHRKPGPGDHPLKHWRAVGLRYASTTRISNILAVEKKLIKRVLGTLHAEDLARVEHGLSAAFGL